MAVRLMRVMKASPLSSRVRRGHARVNALAPLGLERQDRPHRGLRGWHPQAIDDVGGCTADTELPGRRDVLGDSPLEVAIRGSKAVEEAAPLEITVHETLIEHRRSRI